MADADGAKRDPRAVLVRLLVQLDQGGPDAEPALAAAVAASLGRDADGCWWQVRPLFPPDDDPVAALDRFFEVEGRVGPSRFPLERVAWDLARQLAAGSGAHVEPDLPSAAFEPEDPGGPGAADREGFGVGGTPTSQDRHWALEAVRAREAWALVPPAGGAARGADVVIGHPDSGYTDHPELAGVYDLTRDRDLVSGDDDARDPLTRNHIPIDSRGHGTATATTIASREAGEIAGVAPDAVVVPIRAVNSVVQVFDRDLAKAVDHARRVGCHVISMSLGGTGFLGLRAAIRRAVDAGVIVLAAAGNNVRFVVAPASYPEVIAVGATNVDDQPWAGSSRGGKVAVCGPGGNVWTSGWDLEVAPPAPKVNLHSGTSFGVAHAAGAAALWLAFHGRDRLIERFGASSLQAAFLHCVRQAGHRRPPGWDARSYGVGIIDAAALLGTPLPEAAEVATRAVVAGPLVEDPLERLQRVVPELSPSELGATLCGMLGIAPEELPAALERDGAELVDLLTERLDARDDLVMSTRARARAGPPGPGSPGVDGPRPEATVARRLLSRASTDLARRLAPAAAP